MLRMTSIHGPTISFNPLPPKTKYRWRPLYALLNGLAPEKWIRIALPTIDDVRNASFAVTAAGKTPYFALRGLYGSGFGDYTYSVIEESDPPALWVCRKEN